MNVTGEFAERDDAAPQGTLVQAVPAGWVDPELATLTKDRFFDPAWMYERKFDGERCLAYRDRDGVALMTRNSQRVNSTYPELSAALAAQQAADFVIDNSGPLENTRGQVQRVWPQLSGEAEKSQEISDLWPHP